jgi:hypothetical protein
VMTDATGRSDCLMIDSFLVRWCDYFDIE